MPRYDFTCSNCGHNFEKKVEVGTKLTDCPQCHELGAQKVFNPRSVMIQTPEHLHYTSSDFLPPGGERQQKQIAEELAKAHDQRPKSKTFKEVWNQAAVDNHTPEWTF